MKKTFVFDKSEDELLSIDESTVLNETGIDAARVKESIMKEIKDGKMTKKTSAKKIFSIIAIAAAITAAATLTVQAATGAFHPAFAELYAGEPANGIFPGSNISVKSDTLDIDFLGVTGDETNMVSIYDIRKKDGSNFVDTLSSDDDYRFMNVKADLNISESAYKQLKLKFVSNSEGSGVLYEFVDKKTIRAFAIYDNDIGYIKGEKLTVKDTETTFSHIDEILYNEPDGWHEFLEENEELIKQKTASFKENQSINMIDAGGYIMLAVTTSTTIPLEYELNATLNYKTIEKSFPEAKNKKFTEQNTEWTVKNIKAGAFGMTLDTVTDNNRTFEGLDLANQKNWSDEEIREYFDLIQSAELDIEITLKDGTKVYGIAGSGKSEDEPNGKSKSSWNCTYLEDGETYKPYTLDPNDIISIKCNGTELINK